MWWLKRDAELLEHIKWYREERRRQKQEKREERREQRDYVAVVIALLAAFFTCWQAWEAHQTRKDTQVQFERAQKRADRDVELARKDARDAVDIQTKLADRSAEQAKRSADAATASNKIAVDAMRQDQRPWIKVIIPAFNPQEVVAESYFRNSIGIASIGKTAALNVFGKVRVEFVTKNVPPSLKYRHYSELLGGMLTPNDAVNVPVAVLDEAKDASGKKVGIPHIITKSEADNLESRNMRPAIFGEFTYDDVFGTKHWFNFCRILSVQQGEAMPLGEVEAYRECAKYNATDNN
jgi:hypothetical protein